MVRFLRADDIRPYIMKGFKGFIMNVTLQRKMPRNRKKPLDSPFRRKIEEIFEKDLIFTRLCYKIHLALQTIKC